MLASFTVSTQSLTCWGGWPGQLLILGTLQSCANSDFGLALELEKAAVNIPTGLMIIGPPEGAVQGQEEAQQRQIGVSMGFDDGDSVWLPQLTGEVQLPS